MMKYSKSAPMMTIPVITTIQRWSLILLRPWVMEGSPDEEPAAKDPAAHIQSTGQASPGEFVLLYIHPLQILFYLTCILCDFSLHKDDNHSRCLRPWSGSWKRVGLDGAWQWGDWLSPTPLCRLPRAQGKEDGGWEAPSPPRHRQEQAQPQAPCSEPSTRWGRVGFTAWPHIFFLRRISTKFHLKTTHAARK